MNLPKTWIEFSNENAKLIRNKLEFKNKFKKHFLSELSSTFICNCLLFPSCHLNVKIIILFRSQVFFEEGSTIMCY